MTGLYVDSSALLKRVFIEPGFDDVRGVLRSYLQRGELVATSALTWVEVARSLRRADVADAEQAVRIACSGVARQPLRDTILVRARTMGPPRLRSLDAIHLSAALELDATEMLTYDDRLASAARSVGIAPMP